MGMNPPKWLEDGDVVEVEIEKIGTLKHTVRFE
jgi:2-keto-4-pentenoate hydratase/2-oxohepta-3-ene-1,7-dioic acid hydratase in catechol pathway